VQDRPKIEYERLLPVETPADQVSGIVDFQDERVRDVTPQAVTALDAPSLIDAEALLAFDSSTGRISGGLADLDDQSFVARLRVKSG
jgi:hypothetical protein